WRRDSALDAVETPDRRAVDRHDSIVRLQPGTRGGTVRNHIGRDRQGDRPSGGSEQKSEQHHREQKIGDGPGSHDQGTRADPLLMEGSSGYPSGPDLLRSLLRALLAMHLDVAAEWQPGEFPDRANPVLPRGDCAAKTDREH